MEGRGELSLAARSGRGGTTGRAMGWPAKGRVGLDGAWLTGCRGAGGSGMPGAPEREVSEGGSGARGPERTWPGRGEAGPGADGIGRGGVATGRPGATTAAGAPLAGWGAGCDTG
jgi:hypothetical protein